VAKQESNGAPASDTVKSIPRNVQALLIRLAGARQSAKNRETTEVANRKDIDQELDQLGAGHSKKHLETRSRLVICQRKIAWYRARIKTVADKIDELLMDPTQDLIHFALPDLDQRDPDEASLFHSAGEKGGAAVGDPDLDLSGSGEDDDDASPPELDGVVLPGMFDTGSGSPVPIGDRTAFEEVVNAAVGAIWHMSTLKSAPEAVFIRREPSEDSPVVMTLTRVGDIPSGKPAVGKPAKKKAPQKKKPAGKPDLKIAGA